MIKNFFSIGLIAAVLGFAGISFGEPPTAAVSIIVGFVGICFLILSGILNHLNKGESTSPDMRPMDHRNEISPG
jgi:uncharacterized membrane protein YtjA (UPF0391 family)